MDRANSTSAFSLNGKPVLRMADLMKEAEGLPAETVDLGNGVVVEKRGGFSKMVGSAMMSMRASIAAYDAARVGGAAGQAMFETFRKTHPDQFGEAAIARDKALLKGEVPEAPSAAPSQSAPATSVADGQRYEAAGNEAIHISGGKNVTVTGSAADDFLEVLYGSTVYGLSGNDRISGANRVTLDGGEGDDELAGGKDSTLAGGAGNDRLHADVRSVLDGGDGNDQLWGGGDSTLTGGAGDDLASAYENSTVTDTLGDNYISVYDNGRVTAGAGNDYIEAYDDSVVIAGDGSNWVWAGDRSTVTAGSSEDYVHIGANGDVATGAGADTVIVGANTTVHFNRGDGNDRIGGGEFGAAYVATENLSSSILSFGTGIVPADLTMRRQGNDLLVQVGTDTITLKDVQRHGIPTMAFADGSVLGGGEIGAMVGPAEPYQPASQVIQRFWDASAAYTNQLRTTGTPV